MVYASYYRKSFLRSLFRWRGSLWKGVFKQLLTWLLYYYTIRLLFCFCTPQDWKPTIKATIKTFATFTDRIPLQFLLGFYVVQMVTRWWAQVQAIPWPDDLMAQTNGLLFENDDDTKLHRMAIARYISLSMINAWRRLSSAVANKYPTLDCLVHSGLLTTEELDQLNRAPHPDCQFDYPLTWAYERLRRKLGSIQPTFLTQLNTLRANYRTLLNYDRVGIPLVYTQTATVAVYGYFGFCLIGHQYPGCFDDNASVTSDNIDLVVPFLTILQFVFSVGWLNVAEDLSKPFGDDEADVKILDILRRHVEFAYAAAEAPCIQQKFSRNACHVDVEALFGNVNDSKRVLDDEKDL